ncbi:MAG: alpha/beta fold hydrolase [bacterium]
MGTTIDAFLQALQKSATRPFLALQKGSATALSATEKGLATALNAIQKSSSVSVAAIESIFDLKGRPLAILNGVVGDTLESQKSKLAIPAELLGKSRGEKLCVLVHGLCASEETWRFSEDGDQDYGSLLQQALGYAPLYFRYNSGLHISTNGQRLSKLLDEACKNAPAPIRDIIFIGHSMGGLVVRSACHYGQKSKRAWVKHVKKIFLLGTPHHGNDYEKLGNLASKLLRVFGSRAEALGNRRSAGIKDLRYGYLLDEDWRGYDADALWKDRRRPVPLLSDVDYYLIAATLAKSSDNLFTQYFGDGVIPLRNAAGHSFKRWKTLPFSPDHFKSIKGLSHVRLARDKRVYEQILSWCLPQGEGVRRKRKLKG